MLKAQKYTSDCQDFHGRIKMNGCYSNLQKSLKCSKTDFNEETLPAIMEEIEGANRDKPISKLLLVESKLQKNDAGT